MELLTRDDFREQVFERDGERCVVCKDPARDAHHLIGRKYWSDGGYYLENGVSLCGSCHLQAERNEIPADQLRALAGIQVFLTPEGNRIPWTKFPRTYHLPWSLSLINDDREITTLRNLESATSVVVTEKLDGENTTMYRDHIHARSLDSGFHESRAWVRALHGAIKHDIPAGFRLCGENLYAKHSIRYVNLQSYFYLFGVWDHDLYLSWADTCEYAGLLGLQTAPVIYEGRWDETYLRELARSQNPETTEGYVVRVAGSFSADDYATHVAKYVRAKHIQSSDHWMHQEIEVNQLAE